MNTIGRAPGAPASYTESVSPPPPTIVRDCQATSCRERPRATSVCCTGSDAVVAGASHPSMRTADVITAKGRRRKGHALMHLLRGWGRRRRSVSHRGFESDEPSHAPGGAAPYLESDESPHTRRARP